MGVLTATCLPALEIFHICQVNQDSGQLRLVVSDSPDYHGETTPALTINQVDALLIELTMMII